MRVLAALLLASLLAAAQAPGRVRVSGRVLAADGSPWAGATVTLLAHPVRGRPDVGEPDRVIVASDERGRFTAEVLPRLVYEAWAETGDGPLRRVSYLQSDVIGPASIRLGEAPASATRRRRVDRGMNDYVVEVGDEAGKPVAGAAIWYRVDEALPAPLFAEGDGPVRWSRLGLESGRETWVRGGVTDAKGSCTIQRPRQYPQVVVQADGFALGYQPVGKRESIVLPAGQGLRGRLLHAGQPVAGITLLASYGSSARIGKAQYSFGFRGPSVQTAADGGYAISGPLDGVTVRLEALLPDALCRQLWPQLDAPPVPHAWIATIGKVDGKQPGDVDLAKLAPLTLDVMNGDGSPCPAADVLIRHSSGEQVQPMALVTDRRGRVRVVLPRGSYQVLALAAEAGWIAEGLEVGEGAPVARLTLGAFREVKLRVVDGGGVAVPGAKVQAPGTSYSHVGAFYEEATRWNRAAVAGSTDASGIRVLRLVPWAQQWLHLTVTAGKASGNVRLAVDAAPDELEIVLGK